MPQEGKADALQNGQGPGKWVGSDVGKQDSGTAVAPVPFQSPGGAVRELSSGLCEPGMTCVCFQFFFQDSCRC